jgi:putative peptidoglycan lipid II flippase
VRCGFWGWDLFDHISPFSSQNLHRKWLRGFRNADTTRSTVGSSHESDAIAIAASKDTVHSIRQSSIQFFSGTMLSRISGMFRDITLAFCFGTHEALAALFVAFRLANLARRLFGEGALQSAFIPIFEEVKRESSEGACRFFRDLSLLWCCLLTLLCLISMAGLAAFLHYIPVGQGAREILDLTIFFVPSLLPTCLFGLNISFLQCHKQYFAAAVAPIFFNIVIIVSAFSLCRYTPQNVMPLLSCGFVVGCVAQWLASFLPVFRQCKETLRDHLFSNITLCSSNIKRLWHPLTLGILGIGASQINNAVDAIFARAADLEGPAQLWFAVRFQQLPLALFGIAVSSAILPPLARAIHANDEVKFHSFLEYGLRQVIALLVPCAGVLFVLGMAMINCIYGHGDFHTTSIVSTTGCLQGYTLALVPMGLIVVLVPAFYAKSNYTIPMRAACLSLILNAVLNSIMVFGFGWGSISVTVATSISSWVNALYLYVELKKRVGPLVSPAGWVSCWKTVFVSLITSALVFTTIAMWTSPPVFFNMWQASGDFIPHTLFTQLLHLCVPLSLFAVCLFVCARLFRAQDILSLVKRGVDR